MAKKNGKKSTVQEVIVVGSKTRDVVKESGMNMAGDFTQALSDKTRELISSAAQRAQDNGRKTVRATDL
jgi:histone H3/H4